MIWAVPECLIEGLEVLARNSFAYAKWDKDSVCKLNILG